MQAARRDAVSFSYVIPVRVDAPHARRNLELVLEWLPGVRPLKIIVVEHGPVRNLFPSNLPAGTTCRFLHDDGPFNKGRAMNAGFRLSDGGVVAFGDADMVMPPELLDRARLACEHGMDAVNPYHRLVDLSEQETRDLDTASLPAQSMRSIAGEDRTGYREIPCFAGGVFVVRGQFYEAIGGMDESFLGWGGEDNAMSTKIERMTRRCAVAKEGTAFHLWHPRRRPPPGDAAYRDNLRRAVAYLRMSDADLAALCRRHHQDLLAHPAGTPAADPAEGRPA